MPYGPRPNDAIKRLWTDHLPDICPPEIDQVLALARAGEIATQPPAPLVMGRHLLQAGVTAGPQFKSLL